jgi:hypothetical protein
LNLARTKNPQAEACATDFAIQVVREYLNGYSETGKIFAESVLENSFLK